MTTPDDGGLSYKIANTQNNLFGKKILLVITVFSLPNTVGITKNMLLKNVKNGYYQLFVF